MPWRRFAEGELLCPVCLGLICEPTTAPECGHSFCRNCLVQSLQKTHQRCPACRTTIAEAPEALPINVTLRNIACKLFPDEYASREAEAQVRLPALAVSVLLGAAGFQCGHARAAAWLGC